MASSLSLSSLSLSASPSALLSKSFYGTSLKTSTTTTASFSPSTLSYRPLEISAAKTIQGTVIGNSRDKTVSIEVKRFSVHPLYKKRLVRSKKYHAHDPENKCNVGDWVTLAKCAPVSKTKRFIVAAIRPPKVAGSSRHSGDTDSEEEVEATGELPPLQSEVSPL